jgi:hypothetical protein
MKQDPKPRRQRAKRLDHGTKLRKQGGKEELNTTEVSKCADKEEEETVMTVENCQREIESGGDDSWEDVTTTSGNDSACEELLPHGNMDSTVDTKSTELKSDMPWVVENSEVKSEMIQNTGANSEMAQKTETKSEMFQTAEEDPVMIQKSQLLQNIEAKSEILQNIEVKSGMDQDTEAKPDMIRNTEVKSGNHQKMEGKSEVKMGKLHADGSSLSESGNSTELSKVITNSKVPDMIMQEVAQETERSTDHNGPEDDSEIYFDETCSEALVETEKGTMNEAVDLKEKENKPLIICREKELEGEIKTGSWDRRGHSEEQRKVDIIQNTESESLSDGVAAVAIAPEEKKESNT